MSKSLSILVAVVTVLALSAFSCSVSTASLSDVKTGSALQQKQVVKEVSEFSPDTATLYVSTKLNNAPDDTKVTFTWRYLEQGGQDIDSVAVVAKNGENLMNSSLSKPTNGWPTGRYEVVLKLGAKNSKPIHKKFSVR